jgi:sortase A
MERHSGSGAGSEPTTEQESWFVRPSAAGKMDPGVRNEAAAPQTTAVHEGAARNGTSAAEPVGREVEQADPPGTVPSGASGISRAANNGGADAQETAATERQAPAEAGETVGGMYAPLAAGPPPLPRRYGTPPATAEPAHPEIGADPLGLPIPGTPKAVPASAPPDHEESAEDTLGSRESADDGSLPARGPVAGERRLQDPMSQGGMVAADRPERAADPFNALDIREWFRDTRASRTGAETGPAGGAFPIDPAEPSVPVPPARRRSARTTVARGVGEILVTLGLVILLFCVYQLFYTNIESNRAQAKIKNSLERGWKPAEQGPDAKPVGENFSGIGVGDAFALMHIPRLGRSWEKPIIEGVSLDELARGLGHYPDSAMPGKIGNFAVAGHRATHGEPFRNLNQLRQGDVVIVETENNWYRYVIDSNQIVDPTDVEVVLPVPNQPGAKPTERLITLTTCNPRWASTERLIYWGHLDSVMSKAAGTPAELLG